ncbi:MAG: hypothetical protein AB8B72_00890 [Crocinitomicaceae bacterium]
MKISRETALLSLWLIVSACNNQKTLTEDRMSRTEDSTAQKRQHQPPSIADIFKMDVNKDGKLTKLEVTGPILEDFDKIDTNKDGFITKEELGVAPKPEGPRARGHGGQGRPPQR